MSISSFQVNIRDSSIRDLKDRLRLTRWPDEVENTDWSSGTNMSYLKSLCAYWEHNYSWRKTEAEINALPNFLAEIEGFRVHFIYVKGKGVSSQPLLLTHGWPGSILEMLKIIPLLTEGPGQTFDVVIPSVIGFGFSSKPIVSGCNAYEIAGIWNTLMELLGYEHYGVHGGDIGAATSSWIAFRFPERVTGIHLNYIPGSYRPYLNNTPLSVEEIHYREQATEWALKEGAYVNIQSTKPQTLSYSLNDSPTGLCAWIVEKLYAWSDNQGNLANILSEDEILGNISLYWFTETMPSAMRYYREASKKPLDFNQGGFIKVPLGFIRFPRELPTPPLSYIRKGFNLVRYTAADKGGHFAAMESPIVLADDIKSFFSSIK